MTAYDPSWAIGVPGIPDEARDCIQPARRRVGQGMRRQIRLLMICGAALTVAVAHGGVRYEGLAYARQGGALLYTETHWVHEQGGAVEHAVLYRCPDGSPFARKRLLARSSPQAPDFEFVDARDGYREGVRTTADSGREVFVQPRTDAPLDVRPLRMPPGAVVDAGFDAFVRGQWGALSSGATVTVPFLVPSRFDFWRFRITDARDRHIDGQPVRSLRMRADAWYGFALPGIELAYEPDGRRLVMFEGIGTIRDRQGRHLDVRIEFPKGRRQALPGAADEAASALALPLVRRCPGEVL